ncbi:hypothetical protein VPH35_132478 [Triticum aestivum]
MTRRWFTVWPMLQINRLMPGDLSRLLDHMIIPTAPLDPSSPVGLNGLRLAQSPRHIAQQPPSLLQSRSARSRRRAAAPEPGEPPATLHCSDYNGTVALHHSIRHRRLCLCSIETSAVSTMLHRNLGGHRRSSIAAPVALRRSSIEALDGLDGTSSQHRRPADNTPLATRGVATQRTAKTAEAENLVCSAGEHGECCDATLTAMGAATQHDVHGGNSNTSRATTTKAAMQPRDIAMPHRLPWRMLRCNVAGDRCCDAARDDAGGHGESCDAAPAAMAKSCDAARDVRGAAPSATAGAAGQC